MKTESTIMQLHKRAYNEGYGAGLAEDYMGNTYTYGSEAYKEWELGYQAGQDNAPPCEDE